METKLTSMTMCAFFYPPGRITDSSNSTTVREPNYLGKIRKYCVQTPSVGFLLKELSKTFEKKSTLSNYCSIEVITFLL